MTGLSSRITGGTMKKRYKRMIAFTAAAIMLAILYPVRTMSSDEPADGAAVYVPAYSSIYHGDQQNEIKLTVTLSIRNTDIKQQITITGVDYYDSAGKLLLKYLRAPMQLKALASTSFLIKESENKGGPGAKFIVRWKADRKVSRPIIESIMIGTRGQQGISFSSRGKEISEE